MPSLKLEPFWNKDTCSEAERAEKKTVVGAAKPFGRPPILCLGEVPLTAYIGAEGRSKMGPKSPDWRREGRSRGPHQCLQTPIRRQSELKCT